MVASVTAKWSAIGVNVKGSSQMILKHYPVLQTVWHSEEPLVLITEGKGVILTSTFSYKSKSNFKIDHLNISDFLNTLYNKVDT